MKASCNGSGDQASQREATPRSRARARAGRPLLALAAAASSALTLTLAGGRVGAQDTAAPAATPTPAQLARGEDLYKLCGYCHGAAGTGEAPRDMGNSALRDSQLRAPGIAGLQQWYLAKQIRGFRNGERGSHPDDFGGMRMGPMAITLQSEEDIDAVAAYIASMPPSKPQRTLSEGDPASGAGSFGVCVSCHGPNAKGVADPSLAQPGLPAAPSLLHQGDWYLAAQLRKFRAGVRGSDVPGSPAQMMQTFSMTLPTDEDVLNVVAYISTLSQ